MTRHAAVADRVDGWINADGAAALLDAMSDVLAVVDGAGRVIFMNSATDVVLGVEPAAWSGRDILDLVDPADRTRAERSLQRTISSSGRTQPLQVRVRASDGSVRSVEVSARNRMDDPAIHGIVLNIRRVDERDASAAELHVAREQFRLAFGLSLVGMAIVSLDSRFLAVNETMCRLTGRSEAELLQMSPADVTHPDDRGDTNELTLRLTSGEAGFVEAEKRYVRPDGTSVPVVVSACVVRGADGEPLYFIGQIEDLSRERAAEASATRVGAQLRSLAATLPIGIYRADAEGRCVYSNDRWAEIYGVEPGQDDGWGWIHAIHPDDRARSLAEISAAAKGHGQFESTFRVVKPAGVVRFVRATATAIRDSHAIVIGFAGSVEDITLSVEAGHQLDEANKRFLGAFANAPIGMALVSLEGRWLEVNRSLSSLLGYTADELMTTTFQDVTHPDDLDADLEFVRQVLAREIEGYSMEKRYFHRSGRVVWVNLSVSLVVDADGSPMYFISQIEDITDRKRSDVELHGLAARLARSNRDLEEFASIAAHDLAAPLRVIEGYLHVLRTRCADQLDDEAVQFIANAVGGAERLQLLIDDLLEYSRSTAIGLNPRPVPLSEIVDDACDALATSITASSASILRDNLPTVFGDARQIALVVQNLVANSIKFVVPGATPFIEITAESDPVGWTITVADQGIGIPIGDRERIFKMFKRLHDRDSFPGTGIGLAICKRVVERHGGRIWIGDPEIGTAVCAWFPSTSTDSTHAPEGEQS